MVGDTGLLIFDHEANPLAGMLVFLFEWFSLLVTFDECLVIIFIPEPIALDLGLVHYRNLIRLDRLALNRDLLGLFLVLFLDALPVNAAGLAHI